MIKRIKTWTTINRPVFAAQNAPPIFPHLLRINFRGGLAKNDPLIFDVEIFQDDLEWHRLSPHPWKLDTLSLIFDLFNIGDEAVDNVEQFIISSFVRFL